MEIKICKNIFKLRKENNMTQAQVAEYLGVSPQAVSKWEQEAAVPDVYLLPKIAFLFSVTLDVLFGTTNVNTAELQVSKYCVAKNDRNYKEATESVDNLLEIDENNLKALGLKCHLQYQRGIEFLEKGAVYCQKIIECAQGVDENWVKRGKMQLIRHRAMLGDFTFIEEFMELFEKSRKAEDFNYLLVALGNANKFEEILRWGEDYLESFTQEEKIKIYPNLLEAACKLEKVEYSEKCFEKIINGSDEDSQIFSAFWVMRKLYNRVGNEKKAQEFSDKIRKILPEQGYNQYVYESMIKELDGEEGTGYRVL